MALGAYEGEVGRGSVLNALAHPSVVNPVAAISQGVNAARGITDLRTAQFNLQQAQLQPVGQAMRILAATNPDPSEDQFNAALGAAARNGGNVDSTVANYTTWKALNPNGKPGDYMRALATTGMSPENQFGATVGGVATQQTAAGTYRGFEAGAASTTPGKFTASTFIGQGVSPEWGATRIPVVGPDGKTYMVPQGALAGANANAGVGPAGAGTATPAGGGQDIYSLPKAQFLQAVAQRESGGDPTKLNYVAQQDPTAYARGATASGKYQMTNTTWQMAARLAGIDTNQYPTAMSAPEPLQDKAASALYDARGTADWNPATYGHNWVRGPNGQYTLQANAPGGPPQGPFVGATSAVPVTAEGAVAQPGGGAGANVRPAGGGINYIPASPGGGGGGAAIPGVGPQTPYGAVLTPPAPGTVQSIESAAAGSTQRQQALEAQMNAAVSQRATLEGMEAELGKLPSTGVATGALSTIKNLLVQSGALSQQELDRQSQGLAAQEQFDKFSAMLNGQLLAGMGGQATDARQELTGAATPSSVHSTLGNMGIIHMLEGNLIATQVMGREFRSALTSGQVTPAQFDAWRDSFTKPGPNGARFDPRVFWLASMGPQEQQTYVNSLSAKDKAQLLKNANFAEQKGWVYENKDGTIGTGY